jgi:hypothetical protein
VLRLRVRTNGVPHYVDIHGHLAGSVALGCRWRRRDLGAACPGRECGRLVGNRVVEWHQLFAGAGVVSVSALVRHPVPSGADWATPEGAENLCDLQQVAVPAQQRACGDDQSDLRQLTEWE